MVLQKVAFHHYHWLQGNFSIVKLCVCCSVFVFRSCHYTFKFFLQFLSVASFKVVRSVCWHWHFANVRSTTGNPNLRTINLKKFGSISWNLAHKLYTRYFRRIIRTPVSEMWGFPRGKKILKGVIHGIINSSRSRPIFELFPQSKIFCINWWLAPNEREESQNSSTMSFRWITRYYRPTMFVSQYKFYSPLFETHVSGSGQRKHRGRYPIENSPRHSEDIDVQTLRVTLMFAECFFSLGHLNDEVTPILYPWPFGKTLSKQWIH